MIKSWRKNDLFLATIYLNSEIEAFLERSSLE